MDLLDASADFDPSDFDPLASPFRTAPRPAYESPVAEQQQTPVAIAPGSPFTSAFGASITSDPKLQPTEQQSDLLIDLSAPTPRPAPRPPASKPLLLGQLRLAPPAYAPLRNPSPLKQVFDAAMEADEEEPLEQSSPSSGAFAMDSPPETVRKVGGVREEEGTPVKSSNGRRWSVMEKRMQEEGMMTARKPERSRSVSPSKETSPARFDADSSGFILPIPSDSDCSLLMNEGGSFLLNGSHDAETTLDSFGTGAGFGNLSGIGEEDEEEDLDDRDMANLLNGLSDSCIGGRPPSSMTDSISSILPSSLTSSTRHALSKSQKGPPDVAESLSASTSSSVTIMDNNENDERSLLACSTASYRTHRDSPARPRMVSIQAERFALGAGEAEQTPMKGRLSFGSDASNLSGESRRSSGGSSAAESSSGDVRDMLKGWSGSGDLSLTDLYAQQPPSPLNDTSVVATATFELGLVSPILPDKISALPLPESPGFHAPIAPTAVPLPREQSPTDLMDLSEVLKAPEAAKIAEIEAVQPLVAPAMVRSASANGLKRLQEKMDAIRARTAAPSAPSTSAPSSIDSSPIVDGPSPLLASSSCPSVSITPRRQQQPPARSLLDATPLASSSNPSFTRPASTVRRPGNSRHASIPILEDTEEMDTMFNPHHNAQPTTSPRAEALIDFMDAAATPAPKLARSGGISMPMSKPEPMALATPMARAPARPRTSLLPSARKVIATPSSNSSKENGAPAPAGAAVPASARKEATREKLDRLKEERKKRDEMGRSPVKSLAGTGGAVGGLKRPSVAPRSSRVPPSSSAAAGPTATAGLPRPRPPLGSRTAPTASSSSSSSTATRPSLADTLARKPSTFSSTRVAFKPTVPRPAASVSSSSALGAKPKPSLATSGSSSTGLRRPASSSIGLPVAGGSRIGKPVVGAAAVGGSRIGALGARANGAK